MIKDKKIAIVGGGPGGLTLARLLQRGNANVTVCERDLSRDVRVQGATLDLHEDSGLMALSEAGLMDEFKRKYRPGADKIRIVNQKAEISFDDHTGKPDENFGDVHFRPEIDRGPLRDILLDSLKPGTVIWGSQFTTMSLEAGSWKLAFKNGTHATADIVIGADGANSKIRPFLTPIKPFYSGITAVEGNVYDSITNAPKIHELLRGGKIFAFGDEKTLIVSSKGDGSLAFYTSFKAAESWNAESGLDYSNRPQMLQWFKTEFSGWDEIWLELFDQADANFFPRPIYSMPLNQTWDALANLSMLGDAAHLMPPFAGEGVNMAMLDALELARCLLSDEFDSIQSAISSYEAEMRIRASDATLASLENGEWMHSKHGMSKMLEMFGQ
jgi:2-polyprenyl-6-methoxyphenol hydroxylase-like FAD-dependent oxidoreductase